MSSGCAYATPTRTDPDQIGTVGRLRQSDFILCWFYVSILPLSDIYGKNESSRAGHTRDGLDVIIGVIVVGNEGHDHLKILRTIAEQPVQQ